jgi:hypothetical protein
MKVKNLESGEVHRGRKGGETACGIDTEGSHWVNVANNSKVTCARNGCKH